MYMRKYWRILICSSSSQVYPFIPTVARSTSLKNAYGPHAWRNEQTDYTTTNDLPNIRIFLNKTTNPTTYYNTETKYHEHSGMYQQIDLSEDEDITAMTDYPDQQPADRPDYRDQEHHQWWQEQTEYGKGKGYGK